MELISLGKQPIRPENPTGADIRYDPLFEELQAEVGKLSSPVGAGSMDWAKVVHLASKILEEKSKDLLTASYLAVGLIYTQKMEGLSLGLKIYQDLIETFWDNLFPPKSRIRARGSAIEWWIEKTEAALIPYEGTTLPEEQLNQIRESLEKIEEFIRQNFEEPPAFGPLWERVNSFQAPTTSQIVEEKAPEPPPSEKPPPSISKAPETPEVIASSQDAQRVLNQVLQRIRNVATFLWQENLSNPQPYRLMRLALWSTIESPPPSEDGKTKIPAPPDQIRNILNDLREKGDYENLLKAAESRLPQFIFWIDLNRLVSEAFTHLGENYQKALEVVHQETAHFVNRLPGIENLTFINGTPFADTVTKQWLKEISLRGTPQTVESVSPQSVQKEEDPMEREIEEANQLAKKGKLIEAVDRLQQKLNSSSSYREKLLWRLALSQILIQSKQSKLLMPNLEEILREIEYYRLEEYEPPLALRGLRLVWLGLGSQSDQVSKGKAMEVLNRIAKLDLAEAIRLGKT